MQFSGLINTFIKITDGISDYYFKHWLPGSLNNMG
jgi:hypothetical protein